MTQVMIVYSAGSKIPRRVIVPGNDRELSGIALHPLEDSHVMDLNTLLAEPSPFVHIAAKHGIAVESIPSGRCAVINDQNVVVCVIMADPAIDQHPEGRLVLSDTLNIGDVA